jgi:hypothetical protein
MKPEDRKQYNKNYYETNKARIIEKALTQVVCQFCNRSVINNNYFKHQQSKLCKRKSEQLRSDKLRLQELENLN